MGKAGAKKKKESGKKRKEAKTTKKERKALKRQAAVLEKKPAAAQGVQEAGGKITFAEPETTNDRLKQEPELSLFFVAEESGLAAGALLGYMEAEYQPATGGLRTECITTLHYPLSNFPQEVRRLQQKFQARTETEELEYCRFFFFLGERRQLNSVEDQPVMETILSLLEQPNLYYLEQDVEEEIRLLCVYGLAEAEEELEEEWEEGITRALDFWLELESPMLYGRQVLIRSFFLRELKGRRVLGAFPGWQSRQWQLLLEGGLKLDLSQEQPGVYRKIRGDDLGGWSLEESQEILSDPIYAFGFTFYPRELYLDWYQVFCYALALLPQESLSIPVLACLYQDFCCFLEENICLRESVQAEAWVTEEIFLKALQAQVRSVAAYLGGKEEQGISQNMLRLLQNRYVFLPRINRLLHRYFSKELEDLVRPAPFELQIWRQYLAGLDAADEQAKELALEEAAAYFLRAVPGLKLTGRRAKGEREELDLCCCNASADPALWQLGALIFAECKNRSQKTGVQDIRNVAQIMENKAAGACLLFSRAGITAVAQKEIEKQALWGRWILVFDEGGLNRLARGEILPGPLLLETLDKLREQRARRLEQFY